MLVFTNSMWKIGSSIAKVYSFIFQPFLMPFYSLALLFVYTNFFNLYIGQTLRFLLPVLVFTFVIPSLFTIVLVKMRYVKDLFLSTQSERILPYMIFFVSNLSLTFFFYQAHVMFWFLGLIAAPAIIAFIGLIINFFWKISAHMLGIGGVIGGVLSVCFHVKATSPILLFSILFVIAGFLGVSRLYLKASTAAQVYVGFLLGLVIAYGSVFGGLVLMLSFLK